MRFPRLFLVVLLCLGSSSAAPWPALKTDKPADPAIQWTTLPNGVRSAVRRNAEPSDHVSLRLVVSVGSLHERDNEQGLAHFVEHMIFRGTREHPGESLANLLQREGIGFGPDNTAFTNYDHTIYHLELPNSKPETLKLALSVFYEYANSVTFDPGFIERERGVILSEKATRNSPESRYTLASLGFVWPDSLYARRNVIGTDNVINSVSRDDFVAFYDAWYRPERIAIIGVGDVDPDLLQSLIASTFSPMKARAPARPEPENVVPSAASEPAVNIFTDPGVVGLSISFEHPIKALDRLETHEDRIAILNRNLAFWLFQRRMTRLTQELGDSFVTPNASVNSAISGWEKASFSAATRIAAWSELAASMERELRRALLHGFTENELAIGRKAFMEMLDADLRTEPSRHSEYIISQLVWSLLSGNAVSSPAQVRDEYLDPLSTATVDNVNQHFRSAWDNKGFHVMIGANSALRLSPNQAVAVLNESRKAEVAARPDKPTPEFAYNAFGLEGQIVKQSHEEDLDVHLAEFKNGVRFNFKATSFEKDVVEINVRILGGRLTLKKDQAGLDLFADYSFLPGGLKRHSPSEMSDILSGRSLGLSFRVENDALLFSARCARRDVLLCLKLIAAQITDPGYRAEALPPAKASYGALFSELLASPGGPLRAYMGQTLFSQDKRWGIPTEGEYYRHDLKSLEKWLKPQLNKSPVELCVVGDTTWAEASSAVAKTFGAINPRPAPGKLPRSPKLAQAPDGPLLYTVDPKLKQAAIAWAFPAPEISDVHSERRCRFLAEVLEERMRQCLREELGSAYAPNASFNLDEGTPGCGYFLLYAEVDARRVHEASTALRNEIDRLRREGFTADEFERIRAPFLRSRQDDLRNNNYWAFTVLADAQQRPERLAAARDRTSDTASITQAELQSLLGRYIDRERGFLFISEPAPGHSWFGK